MRPTCFRVPLALTDYERRRNRRGTGYYPFEREGLGKAVLRRTHIGTGSGSDGRGVRGLTAQAHDTNHLGGTIYSARDHRDGDNSTDDNIDNNNSTTSFRYEKFDLHG